MNQKLCIGRFNKSYCVTDGKYLLLVSNVGLEMYLSDIDVQGMRNILDFFVLKKKSLKYNVVFDVLQTSHYKNFMTKNMQAEIVSRFSLLYLKLKEYVFCLYQNKCGKMCFFKVNYSREAMLKTNLLYIRLILRNLYSILAAIVKFLLCGRKEFKRICVWGSNVVKN